MSNSLCSFNQYKSTYSKHISLSIRLLALLLTYRERFKTTTLIKKDVKMFFRLIVTSFKIKTRDICPRISE